MKLKNIIFLVVSIGFSLIGCTNTTEKTATNTVVLAENNQNLQLHISGMTCEIGCAKFIQSKLSKKEGILSAEVIFKDSIANIKFDANKTTKNELIAMIDGLANGKLYKATENSSIPNKCDEFCKEKCEIKTTQTAGKEDCKMECCQNKKA